MIREMGIVSAWLASMGCEGVRRPRRECAAASLCAHRFLCIRIDDAFSAESSAMKVLAISGSLRAASINSALLRTAARLAPPDIEVALCAEVGELPLFNPDLEHHVPSSVARLRAAVAAADALLIASPEYAHGVTGTIKNALDWLVSFEPFVNKPVAVLNASPRAHHADSALRETLKTMSAVIVESASISIPLLGAHISEGEMAELPSIAQAIRESLASLHRAVALRQSGDGPAFPV
jgi:NAD(P)H-dependent FMN reductase